MLLENDRKGRKERESDMPGTATSGETVFTATATASTQRPSASTVQTGARNGFISQLIDIPVCPQTVLGGSCAPNPCKFLSPGQTGMSMALKQCLLAEVEFLQNGSRGCLGHISDMIGRMVVVVAAAAAETRKWD